MSSHMMLGNIWRRIVPKVVLVVVILVVIGIIAFYFRAFSVHADNEGWVARDKSIQYSIRLGLSPVISGEKVVIPEKQPERKSGAKLSWDRDTYYIRALNLKNGDVIYRRKLVRSERAFQAQRLWAWGDNVVVYGFDQEQAGIENRKPGVLVIDPVGEIISSFSVPSDFTFVCVDEIHGWLVGRSRSEAPQQSICFVSLTTGQKSEVQDGQESVSVIVSGGDGNLYLLRKKKLDEAGINLRQTLEKYSIKPWKQMWSVELHPKQGMVLDLKYDEGRLWYSVCHFPWGDTPDDYIKWIGGPINVTNGQKIETDEVCDPYRITAEVDGTRYVVTSDGQGIRVRRIVE